MHAAVRPIPSIGAALLGAVLWFSSPSAQRAQPATPDGPAYPLLLAGEEGTAVLAALSDRHAYVPGQLLVKFRDGFASADQARALSVLRASGRTSTRWIGDTLLVHAAAEPNAEIAAAILARQPEIAWAQPNYILKTSVTPNDTAYSRQWNLNLINMPAAWDISRGGSSSVIVAVVDTGITTVSTSFPFTLWNGTSLTSVNIPYGTNPDISPSRVLEGRDFIFWNGPVLDMVGHGSHVAGTVLQETNNTLGFAGVAYASRLMPVKVCVGSWELQIARGALNQPGFVDPDAGGCTTSALVNGIRYAADNGAKVINLSLGGPGQSPALLDALRYAVGRGVFVAMAVGNEFDEGNPVEYPAGYGPEIEGAMAVAAVGRSRRRSYYSNTGAHVEIAAPGGDFRDGGADGVVFQVTVDTRDSDPRAGITAPRFDRYAGFGTQGTSMAAPHIAGVAALLVAQGITSPAAIEAALKQLATDLGSPGRDDDFGHGLVDARAVLRGLGVAR